MEPEEIKRGGFWLPVIIGILMTPFLFYLAAALSGGGRSMGMATLIFPYFALWGLLFEDHARLVALTLLALQFPIYGAALGAARVRERIRPVFIGLAVSHFVALMVCAILKATSD